jgi:hypothetical protein
VPVVEIEVLEDEDVPEAGTVVQADKHVSSLSLEAVDHVGGRD